ncbi:hypothetical protein CAPTEDRAFT_212816 [Capitella teleta]|uniref:Ig-like domain-containing protein n=1 Tax=Capitella teleta TaxID=283909 RepID=R7TCS7_CAPTE|nr:hypothetical protein CAPTEDRAFT_212816 [Capitella teleta]|eukprot:ELT89272.1 hypothetical protein CAPTEDRAFT_212816 [Capitella teleta]
MLKARFQPCHYTGMQKSIGAVIVTSFLAACRAQFAATPQNVAAYAGNDIELVCASSSTSPSLIMSWYEYISIAYGQIISLNGASSNPPNPEIYTVADPIEGVYNIGIKLLGSSGGMYGCVQLAPLTGFSYANIIVFEEALLCECTVPPGDNAVEEGDEYSMTCSVTYTGDVGWAPKMEWKDGNGVISDAIDNSVEGKLDVTVTRSAAPDHHEFEYSARIYFVAFNGTLQDNMASNIPSFTETHTFDAIIVHYSPRDIEFTEEKAKYVPGDQIVCSASGRPRPEITWRNINNGLVYKTDTLVIIDDMLSEQQSYECQATNVIKGTTRTATRSLTFPEVNKRNNNSTVLSAVLGVLAFILMAIAAVVLYCWIQRRGDCHQQDSPTQDTSQLSKEASPNENMSDLTEKGGPPPHENTSRSVENSSASYANMSHPMEQKFPFYENITCPVDKGDSSYENITCPVEKSTPAYKNQASISPNEVSSSMTNYESLSREQLDAANDPYTSLEGVYQEIHD